MAEKNKMATIKHLKMLALRVMTDSAARIGDLETLIADGHGHLITVTLPAANWHSKVQAVHHESLLANANYCYLAFGNSDVKADDITANGQITFRCEETPDKDLTVNILRLEVET